MLRIGIDVGGTHTDAVLLDGDQIVSTTKAATSADVHSGVIDALDRVLADLDGGPERIDAVMLGTTQFTNAVVERQHLAEVAAIRIGKPSGRGLPPQCGWPEDLTRALGGRSYELSGGTLYDGNPLAPSSQQEIDAVIRALKQRPPAAIAVTAAFAPMNPEPERALGTELQKHLPDCAITLSHQIGRLGLLERENAALLNASLMPFAATVVDALQRAVRDRGLAGRFMISQNDGTLMDADFARRYPALTFASGPTNSLRGASRLTGLANAVVIDIGGTTADIGLLRDGFPRESNRVIEVGGVRTNFRMPDILALGLGGGSHVSADGRQVGPQSVAHRLRTDARIFGGSVLTATDIAVAAGFAAIGDPRKVSELDPATVDQARAVTQAMLNDGIEHMKPSREPLPVILVGGGSLLASDPLQAAASVHRPEHAEVANAIGAAIAQVGGEAERLVAYRQQPREQAIAEVTALARQQAMAAGAEPNSLRVADLEETAQSYSEDGSTRLRVKVIGDIRAEALAHR